MPYIERYTRLPGTPLRTAIIGCTTSASSETRVIIPIVPPAAVIAISDRLVACHSTHGFLVNNKWIDPGA